MNNKLTKGVYFAVFYSIVACLIVFLSLLRVNIAGVEGFIRSADKIPFLIKEERFLAVFYPQILFLVQIVFIMGLLVSGVFTLRLKKWARSYFLISVFLWAIFGLYSLTGSFSLEQKPFYTDIGYLIVFSIIFIFPSFIAIYFLTRKNVKEQFNQ